MTRSALLAALAATVALSLLLACRPDLTGLQVLDVDGLASWRSASQEFAVCDANSDDTRTKYGVIPGAILLSSYRDYDPAAELPSDRSRRLVFYCHSALCGAAADAARKAREAGYRDVWVMEPGITGWVEAGHDVARPEAPEIGS
ncbi:MAG: rhodanese-like domain-containing protein [Myxococcota bacterium]|nr:rhodanese-like domain-containing protein [Myxococcota bacterium]